MRVSHQEQVELQIAQQEFAKDMDHQAAKVAITAIECIKSADTTPGTMLLILQALAHKIHRSNFHHIDQAQFAEDLIDSAASYLEQMEEA